MAYNYNILGVKIEWYNPILSSLAWNTKDFVDYLYSSRLVKYSNFRFNEVIGGIMNWLQNLAQSNKKTNVNNDWTLTVEISRMTNVPQGIGKKEKSNGEVESCVPIKMSKIMTGVDELSQSVHMTTDTPLMTEHVLHAESMPQSQEERKLFSSPTVSDDDVSSMLVTFIRRVEKKKKKTMMVG